MREVEEADTRETPHCVRAGLPAKVTQDGVEDARLASTAQQFLVHAPRQQLTVVYYHDCNEKFWMS